MHVGIFTFATEYSMPIGDLARAAEERGFESLWVPEHTHIPAGRQTPYPGGGDLPREYAHTLDPFVALTAAAGATTRLKLGTGICLLIERDTITTAKTIATLDLVSGGRFLFGVGGGWNREEMQHHGTDYDSRFRKLGEQVQALKRIWTEDVAEYHGEFIDFAPIWSWPKPTQSPHPPILFGGETMHTLRRIVAIGDGWIPRARDLRRVFEGIDALRTLATRAGRDPRSLDISVFAAPPEPTVLARLQAKDVTRTILWLPPEDADATLARLDRLKSVIG